MTEIRLVVPDNPFIIYFMGAWVILIGIRMVIQLRKMITG